MIEFKDAALIYDGREVLKKLNLSISPASFYFLTGPSGSGKTSFLKLCYQALTPDLGSVTIFGNKKNADRDQVAINRQRIGVVHQDCQFLDHLSIEENVLLPLQASSEITDQDKQNMADLLAWVGLSERMTALPPQLSGGERQRAALARAVIMSPEVIIADEPTGNVDWEMGQRLLTLLIELNRMGKTVIVATHDLNLIRQAKAQVAARVLRIKDQEVHLSEVDL